MTSLRAILATVEKKRLGGLLPRRSFHCPRSERQVSSTRISEFRTYAAETSMLKFVILGVASLAFVGTSVAADLPRPQPVVSTAPVGKYPIGKYPIGKSPVGKYPVGKAPVVTSPVVTKG
jgi:hypothetical protein